MSCEFNVSMQRYLKVSGSVNQDNLSTGHGIELQIRGVS